MSNEEKYKKAINELADSYELHLKQWAKRCIDTINEYTTNLQQENKQLKEEIEELKQTNLITIDYQDLEQRNKDLNNILTELEEWLNRDDLSYVETQLVLDTIQKLKEKYK